MIRFYLLVGFIVLASINGFSQQNLFNIPSGDITPKGKQFFQQQININSIQSYAAKTHFVHGLGKGFEVGMNVVNMYFDFSSPNKLITSSPYNSTMPYPYYPLALLTAQKGFTINNNWSATVGTQAGTNLTQSIKGKRFTHYTYALGVYRNEHIKIVGGPYATNWRFVGGGNNVGVMLGTEIHLNNKWLLMADFISGRHKNAVSVVGVTYNVNPKFQLCLGGQIPNINSKETSALVLEINLFNF
jgi:hypothetical protein